MSTNKYMQKTIKLIEEASKHKQELLHMLISNNIAERYLNAFEIEFEEILLSLNAENIIKMGRAYLSVGCRPDSKELCTRIPYIIFEFSYKNIVYSCDLSQQAYTLQYIHIIEKINKRHLIIHIDNMLKSGLYDYLNREV